MDEFNKIMEELEGLTDEQLKSVIYAAESQQVHRRHANQKRFSELLQPLEKAAKDILSEFPQAHCYIDGHCFYLEDLVDDNNAYWERKN